MQKSKRIMFILGPVAIAIATLVLLTVSVRAGVPRFSNVQGHGEAIACRDGAVVYSLCQASCTPPMPYAEFEFDATFAEQPIADSLTIDGTPQHDDTARFYDAWAVSGNTVVGVGTDPTYNTNTYEVRLMPWYSPFITENLDITVTFFTNALSDNPNFDPNDPDSELYVQEFYAIQEPVQDCYLREIDVQMKASTDSKTCGVDALEVTKGSEVYFCAIVTNHTIVSQTVTTLNIPGLELSHTSDRTVLPGEQITFTHADISDLGPKIINADFTATAKARSYNRKLFFGVDVGGVAPYTTVETTDSITITVAPETYTLTVNVVGQGTVTPGSGDYTAGEAVTLTATPDEGWQFDGWGGDLSGTANPASVTMDADKTVVATFSEIIPGQVFLPIAKNSPAPLGDDAIVFASGGATHAINPDGTGGVQMTTNGFFSWDSSPTWSPDRNKIAFYTYYADTLREIYVMNADGSGLTHITQSHSDIAPTWSPDSHRLAFVRLSSGAASGEIHVVNADGSGLTHLTQGAAPDWSPSGDQIVFTAGGRIYRIDADGSNQIALTDAEVTARSPQWSPDGTRIAYSSARENEDPHIFVMDADGTNKTELTNEWESNPRWSPDGDRLLFESEKYPECPFGCLFTMDADGANERAIYGSTAWSPDWSPEGTQVVVAEDRWWDDPRAYYLVIVEADGSGHHDLAGPFASLGSVRWSR